jgi:hypothetical protein
MALKRRFQEKMKLDAATSEDASSGPSTAGDQTDSHLGSSISSFSETQGGGRDQVRLTESSNSDYSSQRSQQSARDSNYRRLSPSISPRTDASFATADSRMISTESSDWVAETAESSLSSSDAEAKADVWRDSSDPSDYASADVADVNSVSSANRDNASEVFGVDSEASFDTLKSFVTASEGYFEKRATL